MRRNERAFRKREITPSLSSRAKRKGPVRAQGPPAGKVALAGNPAGQRLGLGLRSPRNCEKSVLWLTPLGLCPVTAARAGWGARRGQAGAHAGARLGHTRRGQAGAHVQGNSQFTSYYVPIK